MAQGALSPAVAAVGMFDGVHLGHRALIAHVVELAHSNGCRAVIMTFRRHPLATICAERCPDSLMTVDERVAAIRRAGADEVVVLDFDEHLRQLTAHQFITLIHDKYGVKTLVMGFNHRFGSDRLQSLEQYREAAEGTGLEVVRGTEFSLEGVGATVSSSAVRSALLAGDVTTATKMLGRRYSISGIVVSGQQIGREIGFPTANLRPFDEHQLIPKHGVYAVDVKVDGLTVRGMLNIGMRPTVDKSADARLTIEAHLIDYKGDLYGHTMQIELISRLRDERRFRSLDDLISQLYCDRKAAVEA
jgi:riboflavin kinase/FMN adenylyltransferase